MKLSSTMMNKKYKVEGITYIKYNFNKIIFYIRIGEFCMSTNKKNINSVVKALNIIECFSYENKELKLTEIAKMLDMPKSTTSNLVYTLEGMGYIELIEASGKFKLGSKLIRVGQICEASTDILSISKVYMRELRDEYNENIRLTIPYYNDEILECMSVEKIDGLNDINISSHFGKLLPLHYTAAGRVLLAFVKDEILTKTLESMSFNKKTEYTITKSEDLLNEIKIIRQQGFSTVADEGELGIISIAAPIFNYKDEIVGAISIIAPTARVSERRKEIIDQLKIKCMKVSLKLGYMRK